MKKVQKVVFHNNGENRGTYGSLCFLENFNGDLNEKCQRFVNADFDMLVETNLYQVREISMPDWMTEQDYLDKDIELRFAVGLAGEEVFDFDKVQFEKFKKVGEKLQYWFGWSKDKTNNNFIQSLREQFVGWLSDENNKFQSPFSYRQQECAFRFFPHWEAKRVAESIYWNR